MIILVNMCCHSLDKDRKGSWIGYVEIGATQHMAHDLNFCGLERIYKRTNNIV